MRFKIATIRTPAGDTRQVVLERNTGGGSSVEVDATLSVSGAAPDMWVEYSQKQNPERGEQT